jgi:hypothetical protein
MIASTTFTIDGYDTMETKGLVRGIIVRSSTITQGILGGLKNIIGGMIDSCGILCFLTGGSMSTSILTSQRWFFNCSWLSCSFVLMSVMLSGCASAPATKLDASKIDDSSAKYLSYRAEGAGQYGGSRSRETSQALQDIGEGTPGIETTRYQIPNRNGPP